MHVCFILTTGGEAYEYVGDTRLNELLDDARHMPEAEIIIRLMIAMLNDTVTFLSGRKAGSFFCI